MGDLAWQTGWWAMLLVLHVVVASPALALLWWLRRRSKMGPITSRLLPAFIASVLVSPALLPSHFPLLLPLLLAYLGSVQLGVAFSALNLAPALTIAAVVLAFWPMRSNSTLHTDARATAVPNQPPPARAGERGR
jgi:hypothetical protein